LRGRDDFFNETLVEFENQGEGEVFIFTPLSKFLSSSLAFANEFHSLPQGERGSSEIFSYGDYIFNLRRLQFFP
jgi:hypothetical protein